MNYHGRTCVCQAVVSDYQLLLLLFITSILLPNIIIIIYYINRTQSTHNKQLISRNEGSLNKAKHQSNDSSLQGTNVVNRMSDNVMR